MSFDGIKNTAPITASTETKKPVRAQALRINGRMIAAYEFSSQPEKTLQRALNILREREGFGDGDKVIVISDVLAEFNSDAIQLRHL